MFESTGLVRRGRTGLALPRVRRVVATRDRSRRSGLVRRVVLTHQPGRRVFVPLSMVCIGIAPACSESLFSELPIVFSVSGIYPSFQS